MKAESIGTMKYVLEKVKCVSFHPHECTNGMGISYVKQPLKHVRFSSVGNARDSYTQDPEFGSAFRMANVFQIFFDVTRLLNLAFFSFYLLL